MEEGLENVLREAVMKEQDGNEDDLHAVTIWIWAGCQMHKDLNTTKGGCAAMRDAWTNLNESPIPLANKDNAVILAAVIDGHAEPRAAIHANACTVGGGEKLVAIFGAFLNHKDDKKGQHNTFRHHVMMEYGLRLTFPDTSNTRFGSYLEAAAELLERLDFYLEFIEFVRESKEKPTLNHLEENAKAGLLDWPTRTELVVMAVYRELVSLPYITTVRALGIDKSNTLKMGPLHFKVIDHIKHLIENPDLALSLKADLGSATLNASMECYIATYFFYLT